MPAGQEESPSGAQQTADEPPARTGGSRGPTSPPSTTDLIAEAIEIVQKRPMETMGYPILFYFVMMVIQMVVMMVLYFGGAVVGIAGTEAMGETGAGVLMVGVMGLLGLIAVVFMFVLGSIVFAAIGIVWLRALRGQPFELGHLSRLKSFVPPLMVAGAITGAAMSAGYVLLIVPGVIVGLGLAMANVLVIDKGLSGVEAVKESWSLMSGHKASLFVHVLLVGVLAMIAQTATCGLGGVVAIPFLFGTLVLFYDYLVEPGNAYLTEAERGGGHAF